MSSLGDPIFLHSYLRQLQHYLIYTSNNPLHIITNHIRREEWASLTTEWPLETAAGAQVVSVAVPWPWVSTKHSSDWELRSDREWKFIQSWVCFNGRNSLQIPSYVNFQITNDQNFLGNTDLMMWSRFQI